MKMERENYNKERNALISQMKELQEQLQVVKVSVFCMHVAVQYDQVV
jgi:hypothetical protein